MVIGLADGTSRSFRRDGDVPSLRQRAADPVQELSLLQVDVPGAGIEHTAGQPRQGLPPAGRRLARLLAPDPGVSRQFLGIVSDSGAFHAQEGTPIETDR